MAIDPRAFGPSQETQDAQTAIRGAKLAAQGASWAGYDIPYAGTALGLADLFTDPTPSRAAQFAGQTITSPGFWQAGLNALGISGGAGVGGGAASGLAGATAASAGEALLGGAGGASLAGAGTAAGAGAAGAGAGAGAGSAAGAGAASAGAIGSSLAAAAPGLIVAAFPIMNAITKMSRATADKRRMERTRDARILQGQTLDALFNQDNPSAPVGGSTAGDALAAILKHNAGGTWFGDTGHNWYPDPTYGGLRSLLSARGFTGNTEPTLGDVGGVGEIVAGAGQHLIPRDYLDAYEHAWQNQASGREGASGTYGGYSGAPAGALGWESLLRRVLDAPGPTYVMPEQAGTSPLSRAGTAILPEYERTDQGLTMTPKPSVEWPESGQAMRNGVAVDPWEALLPAPPPGSSPEVMAAFEAKRANLINNATMSYA